MLHLEPEDVRLLAYWQAIGDRANREWADLESRKDASEIDTFFYHRLMQSYGQMRSTAKMNIEEILSGRVQWHRHEMERMQARKDRLAHAKPGDILHHLRDGDFVLRKRNKYDFRVEPCAGGPQHVLPQGDFRDATLAPEQEKPVPSVSSPTLFDLT